MSLLCRVVPLVLILDRGVAWFIGRSRQENPTRKRR
jgi:hypothetical protein